MSGVRILPGRMGPFLDGFGAWLVDRGYMPRTRAEVLRGARRLGRWMQAERVEVGDLDESAIRSFLDGQDRAGRGGMGRAGLVPLLCYLRGEGVVTPEAGRVGRSEELLVEYRRWLTEERGLASVTVRENVRVARRLIESRNPSASGSIEGLCGSEVIGFLLAETSCYQASSAKGVTGQLRSFLRFCNAKGLIRLDLAASVPPVAGWRNQGLPKGIRAADVERLVGTCDTSVDIGVRDRAILMLVSRLGLRCVEVARLELGDIDWRAGEIALRGKARRQDRLPLPWEAGEALVAYLKVRRRTAVQQVFLTFKAPTRAISPQLVNYVCRQACQRAGLPPVGAHRLRHTLATELLRRGASLIEVGQVLRHQDLVTTSIYAKVDLVALRSIAKPWPGWQR